MVKQYLVDVGVPLAVEHGVGDVPLGGGPDVERGAEQRRARRRALVAGAAALRVGAAAAAALRDVALRELLPEQRVLNRYFMIYI